MLTLVPEQIEAYAREHSSPWLELHDRLRDETNATCEWPQMMVGPLQGRVLTLLTRLTGARLAVEVGTFTGCSALHIAEGLAPGGRLITCDVDEKATAIARRYFDESPFSSAIEIRLGQALDTLRGLEGPVDFVFLDADKVGYVDYWERLLPLVRSGGVIVADNVLWSGRVLDPREPSDHAIVRFNRHVAADPRVEQALLTVRDGLMLAVKR